MESSGSFLPPLFGSCQSLSSPVACISPLLCVPGSLTITFYPLSLSAVSFCLLPLCSHSFLPLTSCLGLPFAQSYLFLWSILCLLVSNHYLLISGSLRPVGGGDGGANDRTRKGPCQTEQLMVTVLPCTKGRASLSISRSLSLLSP